MLFFRYDMVLLVPQLQMIVGRETDHMIRIASSQRVFSVKEFLAFLLIGSFIFGFLSGVLIAFRHAESCGPLIQATAATPISVASLFVQIFLSFSLSILIYSIKRRYLALSLFFVQALIFGFVATCIYSTYRAAHWLISPLMLFTTTALQISLIWFWLRNISMQHHTACRDLVSAFLVAILAAFLDVYLISPFVLSLFT